MTSGQFKSFPADQIWVDRAKRQRRTLEGISELAESIAKIGLINPPVIRHSGEIVAGERRWTAIKSLGWTHLPVQFIEDLPEHEVKQVELEENIRRIDLSWQDQCAAVLEYHELRTAEAPEWSAGATGEALGYSKEWVNKHLVVAREMRRGNERVIAADKFSKASSIVERTAERARSAERETLAPKDRPAVPILNEDFTAWQRDYAGPKFNLMHCDFPYGVRADRHDQGAADTQGGYEDTFENYLHLLNVLDASMVNVVADSAHLIFWFSMDYYDLTRARLTGMGWTVNPFPLIWFKSDGSGILPDPRRGPRRVYETAFFASRGDRKIVTAVANCFPAPVTKQHHMSEKNLDMLKHFMRFVCDEHSSVLDPTCGSANALIAARQAGATTVLGLERDAEFHERAVANWRGAFDAD